MSLIERCVEALVYLTHLSHGLVKHSSGIVRSLTHQVHLPGPRGAAEVHHWLLQDLSGYLGEYCLCDALSAGGNTDCSIMPLGQVKYTGVLIIPLGQYIVSSFFRGFWMVLVEVSSIPGYQSLYSLDCDALDSDVGSVCLAVHGTAQNTSHHTLHIGLGDQCPDVGIQQRVNVEP